MNSAENKYREFLTAAVLVGIIFLTSMAGVFAVLSHVKNIQKTHAGERVAGAMERIATALENQNEAIFGENKR